MPAPVSVNVIVALIPLIDIAAIRLFRPRDMISLLARRTFRLRDA